MTEIKAQGLDEARAVLADCDRVEAAHAGTRERLTPKIRFRMARHLRHALAVADQLAGEVARLTAERADLATTLYREGYTPCSSPACNCGSWHGGHIAELRARLRHTAQLLIAEVGAGGPMDAEAAAEKAVATIIGLRAERDEARRVGPRWERKDYDTGPSLWRLRVGDAFLNGSGILTADGLLPITTDDGQAFSTLPEAARAVCTRLGLPLITEGLPKEDADA